MRRSPRSRRLALPPLAPGARIAVVSPASVVDRDAVRAGMRVLESWGYRPVPGRHVFGRHGDLAGTDAQRAADLVWALTDREIDAVWAARGGWGTPRLFDLLDLDAVARAPRWVLGFSDVTALHLALDARGIPALHAPLVTELATRARYVERDLRAALAAPGRPRSLPARALVAGRAKGTLAGGCLSLLAAVAGTPWQPDLRGRIVFLEDIGEPPYRIDRMLWQVRASGMLDGIAGLAFGQFVRCAPAPGRASRTLRAVLADHARALGVPAVTGVPAGHGPRTRVLTLGLPAGVDTARGVLRIAQPS